MGLSVKTENAELASLLKSLPLRVRARIDERVMERALGYDLIEITPDGRLRWLAGNKTLLAYFCARMFCGDHGQYSRRLDAMLWQKGKGRFPNEPLCRLFGVSRLKQRREKRIFLPLPEMYELIDCLFVA